MPHDLLGKIKRVLRKPPQVIARRLWQEIQVRLKKRQEIRWRYGLTEKELCRRTQTASLTALWHTLSVRAYPAYFPMDLAEFTQLFPEQAKTMLVVARRALNKQVDLLGSGLIELGVNINWQRDYKSGKNWPLGHCRDLRYGIPEEKSDVKFPWELSRMQWLIPVAQSYWITRDERYAEFVRDILLHWITHNPYAYTINWSCTMEVALRIIIWTWFFQIFKNSHAWQEQNFQRQFLSALYLHGEFTTNHLEYSDVNGNHYTTDAAGLVFAGLFWGDNPHAQRWAEQGWKILTIEMPRQVHADGVDFEASVPYHRLVTELFLLPALYREKLGLTVAKAYRQRLIAMAKFTQAYSRVDGSVPLIGDADDARVLPFGTQPINDHRYLCNWIGLYFQQENLLVADENCTELYWQLGPQALRKRNNTTFSAPESQAFREGGFYIMRHANDHVFIDCGPLGLAGRGGHGHNDALSLEVMLCGELLLSDSGAYVYTADYAVRNRFRATAAHNTPQIDNAEINRFIRWDYLWNLHDDAKPQLIDWQVQNDSAWFCGRHSGYQQLVAPVMVKRTVKLDYLTHAAMIHDEFSGEGEHQIVIPFHLAPQVMIDNATAGKINLSSRDKKFIFAWENAADWKVEIMPAEISPSYGVLQQSHKIVFQNKQALLKPLFVRLSIPGSAGGSPAE